MGSIRVIIGPLSSGPFASGLRILLSRLGAFEVYQINGREKLTDALAAGLPQVLILEGREPSEFLHYLETYDNLSVIVLDPLGDDACVLLKNPDRERLVRVIQSVATAAEAPANGKLEDRVHLVYPGNLAGTARLHEIPTVRPVGAELGLDPITTWLDLTLAGSLSRLVQRETGTSVPGWSVDAQQALELLGEEVANLSEHDRCERLVQADGDLIIRRNLLTDRLAEIARAFSLSDGDLRALCLVLAPEIDGKYATAMGVLQDDLTRRRPGLTLLANLLGADCLAWTLRQDLERGSLTGVGRLIVPDPENRGALAVEVGYMPVRAVLRHLVAETAETAAHAVGARLIRPTPGEPVGDEHTLVRRLKTILGQTGHRPILRLRGNGEANWFQRIASLTDCAVVQGDLRFCGRTTRDTVAEAIADWVTLGQIHNAILVIEGIEHLETGDLRRAGAAIADIGDTVRLLALDGDCNDLPAVVPHRLWEFAAPRMSAHERERQWTDAARRAGLTLNEHHARRLAATLRLDSAAIDSCIALSRLKNFDGETDAAVLLPHTAIETTRQALPAAARRIETVFTWDDIVLPKSLEEQLRMIPAHVIHAGRVFEDWGFGRRLPYGQGVAALFSGASGTGKTMAAQIIAGDLGVDLLQVDLSKTISKYIGETEKNLDRVFDAAERARAVLLFDEADALFGKRTEVKDAHDRHANVEVAYLLQRMESFGGLAILTSNLKQNMDQAFLRRLRFAVDFPMPSASEREAIWRRSFPENAPIDVDVDVAFLARRLTLTGGNIQQIAIHAAFAASAEDKPIAMVHVVAATRQELVKVGMLNAEKNLDGLAA